MIVQTHCWRFVFRCCAKEDVSLHERFQSELFIIAIETFAKFLHKFLTKVGATGINNFEANGLPNTNLNNIFIIGMSFASGINILFCEAFTKHHQFLFSLLVCLGFKIW